jgi:nitrite reductase/ring-hydroxylating ferredoxin subunit
MLWRAVSALTYMLAQNRVNSTRPPVRMASPAPFPIELFGEPAKAICLFAISQVLSVRSHQSVMAENPVPVCAAADLAPGNVKSFEVGDEIVAVYNIDGTFYATEARCTHATADLADGILEGDVIECSLHFGAFNVRTGKAVQAPCFVDLKTFRTEVKDGQVLVDLSTPAAA